MALNAQAGTFNVGTGGIGTTYSVTGLSFQPTVVIFSWAGPAAAATGAEQDIRGGFGFAIGPTSRACVAWMSDHAQTVGESDRVHLPTGCIATVLPGIGDPQPIDGVADFDTFLSDGFRVIIDDAFATAIQVNYLALGGNDLTDLAIGELDAPTTATTVDVLPGFQPDAVFIIGGATTNPGTVIADLRYTVGFAARGSTPEQAVFGGFSNDGPTTSDTASYGRTGEITGLIDTTATTVRERASLSAWLANGFTLDFAEVDGGVQWDYSYLAIKGGSWALRSVLTSTVNGTDISVSDLANEPVAMVVLAACSPEDAADTPTPHSVLSVGFGAGPTITQANTLVQEKDAIGTMDCFAAINAAVDIYKNANVAGAQAIEGRMVLQTMDATGYTFDMVDGDDAANLVAVLSVGEAGAAEITGSLSETLGDVTLVGDAAVEVQGITTATLGEVTVVADGTVEDAAETSGSLDQTLGELTLVSAGAVDIAGQASVTLGALTATAAGTVEAQGVLGSTLGAMVLSGAGAVEIQGALAGTLGTLTVAGLGTAEIAGVASQTLGVLTVDAAGVVGNLPAEGTLDQTLGELTAAGLGAVEVRGAATPTLGALIATSAGEVEVRGALAVTLGVLTLAGQAGEQVTIYAPSARPGFSAHGTSFAPSVTRTQIAPSATTTEIDE